VNLGFQYIWIDSLCIVQDDPEDWKRESLSMHEVYKNASCNVSASGFPDGAEGFILNERRIDPTPVTVSLGDESPEIGRASPQNPSGDVYLLTHENPWLEIKKGPIFLRAWTLQEQLLVSTLAN
jgi:hypothetical protein